jgi:hypothetical protein
MDVEASRAIRQAEVGASKTMIERTQERFDIKPERLAGDTAYKVFPTHRYRGRNFALGAFVTAVLVTSENR